MLEMGDVAAMPLRLGGYGACQVSGLNADGFLTVCALDWHSDAIPTLDDLASAGPMTLDHHNWSARPNACMVSRSDALRLISSGSDTYRFTLTHQAR
ncbi:hypothetical protein Pth03_75890 [Planotetraspora thailandica]|uniref:Uncharacterized protein n=1 Tax=Planotetraspora thailandica TaxID=487172 RepID=A0A8J3Y1V1_9ACTN|nr:hypothetical protein Pth03_75890 [Planotetraspora thailandica]